MERHKKQIEGTSVLDSENNVLWRETRNKSRESVYWTVKRTAASLSYSCSSSYVEKCVAKECDNQAFSPPVFLVGSLFFFRLMEVVAVGAVVAVGWWWWWCHFFFHLLKCLRRH